MAVLPPRSSVRPDWPTHSDANGSSCPADVRRRCIAASPDSNSNTDPGLRSPFGTHRRTARSTLIGLPALGAPSLQPRKRKTNRCGSTRPRNSAGRQHQNFSRKQMTHMRNSRVTCETPSVLNCSPSRPPGNYLSIGDGKAVPHVVRLFFHSWSGHSIPSDGWIRLVLFYLRRGSWARRFALPLTCAAYTCTRYPAE